jgi:hypothetical protein
LLFELRTLARVLAAYQQAEGPLRRELQFAPERPFCLLIRRVR